jgi:hypothetical protein
MQTSVAAADAAAGAGVSLVFDVAHEATLLNLPDDKHRRVWHLPGVRDGRSVSRCARPIALAYRSRLESRVRCLHRTARSFFSDCHPIVPNPGSCALCLRSCCSDLTTPQLDAAIAAIRNGSVASASSRTEPGDAEPGDGKRAERKARTHARAHTRTEAFRRASVDLLRTPDAAVSAAAATPAARNDASAGAATADTAAAATKQSSLPNIVLVIYESMGAFGAPSFYERNRFVGREWSDEDRKTGTFYFRLVASLRPLLLGFRFVAAPIGCCGGMAALAVLLSTSDLRRLPSSPSILLISSLLFAQASASTGCA